MGYIAALLVAFAALPILLVVYIQLARAKRHRRTQQEVWGAIANRRGGRFHATGTGFNHHQMSIPLRLGEARVMVFSGVVLDRAIASDYRHNGGWFTHVILSLPTPGRRFAVTDRRLDALGNRAFVVSGGNAITAVLPGCVLDPARIEAALWLVDEVSVTPPTAAAAA